jgi:DNA-binding response OmpR family regulator
VKAKILLVDDDSATRETMRALLEAAGYDVVAVGDTLRLAETVREWRPEIVLFDVDMTTASAEELPRVVEKTPEIERESVIFYSSRNSKALEDLVWETGALGAILKTVNTDAFLAELRTLLRRKSRISSGFAMKPIESNGSPSKKKDG